MVAVLLALSGCTPDEDAGPVPFLGNVGSEAVIGLESDGNPAAVFHRVLDAVLLSDRLVVLDASPPYVRAFDFKGNFLYSAIEEGEGPKELRRPVSLGGVDGRTFVVNDPNKVLVAAADGAVMDVSVRNDRFVRGVIGCAGGFLELSTPPGFQMPGSILTSRLGDSARAQLVALDSIRSNSRRVHPLWAHRDGDVAIFYSEEIGRHRLLRVGCGDNAVSAIAIDSVGRPEFFQQTGARSFALHPAAPPIPAGLILTGQGVLWATHEHDSTTTLALIDPDGGIRRTSLNGWIKVLHRAAGHILLARNDPVPHVYLLREEVFLDAVAEASEANLADRVTR